MTRNYEGRHQQKLDWIAKLVGALEQYDRHDGLRGSCEKLREIIDFHGLEGRELVSFYLYGQPTPEYFTAGFLVDDDYVQEVVANLLSYPEFGLHLDIESWPDPEYYVKAKSSVIPWPGIGQPTPAAISTET